MNGQTKLTGIKAVVFDVFGTLVEIGEKRRPYVQLMQLLCDAGRVPKADDAARIMTNNVGLAGAAKLFGVDLPVSSIAALELDLYAELVTIKLYPEVLQTLASLRDAGYKIGLCSNLAAPYAVPVKMLLPFELNAYTWSFEAGVLKPDLLIYEKACAALGCLPHEAVMIGDTLDADHSGSRRFGMHGFHLARNGDSPVRENLISLDGILNKLS